MEATREADGSILLSGWESGIERCRIYRRDPGKEFLEIKAVEDGTTVWPDTKAPKDKTVWYFIITENAVEKSPNSDVKTVPPLATPHAPTHHGDNPFEQMFEGAIKVVKWPFRRS